MVRVIRRFGVYFSMSLVVIVTGFLVIGAAMTLSDWQGTMPKSMMVAIGLLFVFAAIILWRIILIIKARRNVTRW